MTNSTAAMTLADRPVHIPPGLPELDGFLTREERVQMALDVIDVLRSCQRKIQLASMYFSTDEPLPHSGQLHSSRIRGTCRVCALGLLFLKSVDRFDQLDLELTPVTGYVVAERTERDWGIVQANLIEDAFEGRGCDRAYQFFCRFEDRKPLMIAICENIVANHGEFVP